MFEPQSLSQGIGILILGLSLHFIILKINTNIMQSKTKANKGGSNNLA